jgi:hypothetical protein
MSSRIKGLKGKRKPESILLVFLLVATSMIIVFPLTAPKAEAVLHDLGSAAAEDGNILYDVDGVQDGIVHWASNQDHIIPTNYIVENGFTLDIPALNFGGDPATANEVSFLSGGLKMEVRGTLITHPNSILPRLYTAFIGDGGATWQGIEFRAGSEGIIQDCYFSDAQIAVRFFSSGVPFPPPNILFPGIYRSYFTNIGQYGVQMADATGYTTMELCTFDEISNPNGIGVYVRNGNLDIKDTLFISHGLNLPQLYIRDSEVYADNVDFAGLNQPGNLVRIRGNSNQTVFSECNFELGAVGYHSVLVEGSTPLFDNCSFDTSGGRLSVIANEVNDIPAHPILLNPVSTIPGDSQAPFNNSTINATGNSSITLKWYMDVNVRDPNGNPIDNAPVWVKDRNGNASEPSSKITDSNGWARWFVVTELILYNDTRDIFNPFNVSALNNSIYGYSDPEASMNVSKEVNVTVPFNLIPNTPPVISWISTPAGVQSGNINIDFIIEDPNPGDNGNISISVEYSTDGILWESAVAATGSDLDHLLNNTIYHFVWDSANPLNLQNNYSATVYIRIIPKDRTEYGTLNQTGSFTVDNKAPDMLTPPVVTFLTNETATIEWTVNEDATATVWYGLDDTATMEQDSFEPPAQAQTVVLTGLIPGRKYTYYANSTDIYGNPFSTYPAGEVFYTQVHIPLNKGWNLISLPPDLPDTDLAVALAPIAGDYDAVQRYNPSDPAGDNWKHNKVGKPNNDLDMVMPSWGLWIHMINAATFIPSQNVPITGGPATTVSLIAGWNLVGYPSSIKQDVDSALASVTYDMVMTYDAASGQWMRWESGSGGNLVEMNIGHAYYIHVPSDTLWNVDYV